MDETGLQEGDNTFKRIIGSASTSGGQYASLKNTAWITIIKYIYANRIAFTPTIIFKSTVPQSSWKTPECEMPDRYYQSTPSRWCNQQITTSWLKEVFLLHTELANPSQ